MILVDTSAWVEYDRATGSTVDQRLTALIAGGGPLCVTEPVVMEVVAGARDDTREGQLRRLLAYDADLARISIVMGIEMDAGSLLA